MQVVSVKQLNQYVKSILDGDKALQGVCVSGEISDFKTYPSGHSYFTLKDDAACISCTMFRSYASHLTFRPENGMKVLAIGKVSLYSERGTYQLGVTNLQPDGVGALQMAYEQLKKKLESEGLFDKSRKRPIPKYPQIIGVITAETGAAIRDIFSVLKRRYPLAKIVFRSSLVQGNMAAADLTKAVIEMNACSNADVIIIGRGGGSIEDLWCFNDETLARTIADSKIPVISAVGHETDFTICDFVADLRAATPSVAAESAVPDQIELQQHIDHLEMRLNSALDLKLKKYATRLSQLTTRPCLNSPFEYIHIHETLLNNTSIRLANALNKCIQSYDKKVVSYAGKLDALSPLKVLSRGYSITTKGSKVISSIADVQPNDSIQIRVADGDIHCTVEEK